MERSTAKTLALISPLIMGVVFLMMFLSLGITILVMLPLGFLMFLDPIIGVAMIFTIVLMVGIFLVFLILPAAAMYIGYFKVYKPISEDDYSDPVKTWMIIAMVLCFIGGSGWIGWIAGGMYIFILVNWEKLKNPMQRYYPPPGHYPPPGYYQQPPPPGYQPPPPGYYQQRPSPGEQPPPRMKDIGSKKKSGKKKRKK